MHTAVCLLIICTGGRLEKEAFVDFVLCACAAPAQIKAIVPGFAGLVRLAIMNLNEFLPGIVPDTELHSLSVGQLCTRAEAMTTKAQSALLSRLPKRVGCIVAAELASRADDAAPFLQQLGSRPLADIAAELARGSEANYQAKLQMVPGRLRSVLRRLVESWDGTGDQVEEEVVLDELEDWEVSAASFEEFDVQLEPSIPQPRSPTVVRSPPRSPPQPSRSSQRKLAVMEGSACLGMIRAAKGSTFALLRRSILDELDSIPHEFRFLVGPFGEAVPLGIKQEKLENLDSVESQSMNAPSWAEGVVIIQSVGGGLSSTAPVKVAAKRVVEAAPAVVVPEPPDQEPVKKPMASGYSPADCLALISQDIGALHSIPVGPLTEFLRSRPEASQHVLLEMLAPRVKAHVTRALNPEPEPAPPPPKAAPSNAHQVPRYTSPECLSMVRASPGAHAARLLDESGGTL